MQPLSSQKRFDHDMDELRERLAKESDEGYRNLSRYDIAAVRYDWEPDAVKRMKSLCEKTDAEFVSPVSKFCPVNRIRTKRRRRQRRR